MARPDSIVGPVGGKPTKSLVVSRQRDPAAFAYLLKAFPVVKDAGGYRG